MAVTESVLIVKQSYDAGTQISPDILLEEDVHGFQIRITTDTAVVTAHFDEFYLGVFELDSADPVPVTAGKAFVWNFPDYRTDTSRLRLVFTGTAIAGATIDRTRKVRQ